MKYILVLPLLHHAKIKEAMKVLDGLIITVYAEDERGKRRWKLFFGGYFTTQWLKRVKPEIWCVFGEEDRTNNYMESLNSVTAELLGIHPPTYKFTSKSI